MCNPSWMQAAWRSNGQRGPVIVSGPRHLDSSCDIPSLARMVSLTSIIMGHHYRSNNCKVIHHIHIAQIKVSCYIDS
jgi:hypothetical protein